ncbi:37S ribosomal protein S23 mitochondrial [Agyrium rufum]|nr:37S ribosomal protein S23 mitochondrial [Agyrium rufum]
MALQTCWRCSSRQQISHLPFLASPQARQPSLQLIATFTSSTGLAAPPPKNKNKGNPQLAPKRGEKTTFTKTNKREKVDKSRRPAPGERKALRKRIVLSNTNALEVEGLEEFAPQSLGDGKLRGQVIALPGPVVDQLRAVEAFKTTQGWNLFRKPATLTRKETVEYGGLVKSISEQGNKDVVRRVFIGEKSSGKSMLLLQVLMMTFMEEWVVIHIPEAMELANGHTDYAPLPAEKGQRVLYQQPTYLSTLLGSISKANKDVLSKLNVSHEHTDFPTPLPQNLSLDSLIGYGAQDSTLAHATFIALMKELTSPSTEEYPRPPLMISLDGLGHIMKSTAYSSPDFKPIHAHDLHLPQWFISHLVGSSGLPNGGAVIASTSASNRPATPALDLALSRLEAQQDASKVRPSPNDLAAALKMSPIAPFLRATEQQPTLVPQRDPHKVYDKRVLDVLSNEKGNNLRVQRLEPLTKEDARGLLEYYAKSGVLRQRVEERLVGEKWSLSAGVVGELERCTFRMRI